MKKQSILLTLVCFLWVHAALGQSRLYDNGPYQPNFGISPINTTVQISEGWSIWTG